MASTLLHARSAAAGSAAGSCLAAAAAAASVVGSSSLHARAALSTAAGAAAAAGSSSTSTSTSGTSTSSSKRRRRPASIVVARRALSSHMRRSSDLCMDEEADAEQGGYARAYRPPTPRPQAAPEPAYEVVFVRHGQSTWNRANRFIGWCDTPLTEQGLEEARAAGQILRQHNVKVDEVHTSLLKRSVKTAWLILQELGLERVPVHCHWRLNERSYGALVGLNKKECVAQHGAEQVKLWRRSYDVAPPPQDPGSRYFPGRDGTKYRGMQEHIPLTESLKDVMQRAVQHWEEVVVPSVKAGKRVAVVGHENNLRSLLMHIDGIPREQILHLEVPRAVPLLMQFDADMRPIKQPGAAKLLSGKYLISAKEIEALEERDRRQVYDLSIQMNLEELDFKRVMQAMEGKKGPACHLGSKPASTSTGGASVVGAAFVPHRATQARAHGTVAAATGAEQQAKETQAPSLLQSVWTTLFPVSSSDAAGVAVKEEGQAASATDGSSGHVGLSTR